MQLASNIFFPAYVSILRFYFKDVSKNHSLKIIVLFYHYYFKVSLSLALNSPLFNFASILDFSRPNFCFSTSSVFFFQHVNCLHEALQTGLCFNILYIFYFVEYELSSTSSIYFNTGYESGRAKLTHCTSGRSSNRCVSLHCVAKHCTASSALRFVVLPHVTFHCISLLECVSKEVESERGR